MKKYSILLLALTLLLTGCSYNQFGATMTGSSLGGMFGSAIGGIIGGPRGSDIGTVVGMVGGGVAGAATSSAIEQKRAQQRQQQTPQNYAESSRTGTVSYSRANSYDPAAANSWQTVEISNVQFADRNDNRALDAGEEAYITFEIHNRGTQTLYNVAPVIVCSDRSVTISPTAIVSSIAPGQGVRYKAALVAGRRLHRGQAAFQIRFGSGKQAFTAKTFQINTNR